MKIHIVEGIAGCHYARAIGATAVVVDALRASCTASMLFHAGALDITLVSDVPSALAFKQANPSSLLFGERQGLPPEGFDYGNSPRTVEAARNHSIAFTTSNGTALMLEAWGAPEVLMASTTNAHALVQRIAHHERDVVLIPAGNVLDLEFSAQEDWVTASHIASIGGHGIGEGDSVYREWAIRIKEEGICALFDSAPHAENLRGVGLSEDIAFCAQVDVSTAIPHATQLMESGLRLERV